MILHDFLDYLASDFPDLEGVGNQVTIIDEFQKYAQDTKSEQSRVMLLKNTYGGDEAVAKAEERLDSRDPWPWA